MTIFEKDTVTLTLWYLLVAGSFLSFGILNWIGVENLPWFHSPKMTKTAQLESTKFIADWTKWLVPINAALSVASIYFEKYHDMKKVSPSLRCAATSFVLSLITAGLLLGAIPGVTEEIPRESSVFTYRQFGWFQLANMAFLEHVLFIVGLLFLLPYVWPRRSSG